MQLVSEVVEAEEEEEEEKKLVIMTMMTIRGANRGRTTNTIWKHGSIEHYITTQLDSIGSQTCSRDLSNFGHLGQNGNTGMAIHNEVCHNSHD